jgi:hypothetical protein
MEPSNQPAVHFGNTLENGIQGHYDFNIKEILSEAWQKTYGIKATYWKAMLQIALVFAGFFLISYTIAYGFGFIAGLTKLAPNIVDIITIALTLLIQIVFLFIMAPLGAGLVMVGVKHITGQTVTATSVFNYYSFWKRLWVVPFIISVINIFAEATHHIHPLISLFFSLLLLCVATTYLMFPLLIVEKKLAVGAAMKSSRKVISHHWFKTLWLLIVWMLIGLGSILTLGILFIWTGPMINNSFAILYRDMFGINEDHAVKNVLPQT